MRVVEVLGHGCQKCQFLEQVVREVAVAAGIDTDVRHVTDEAEIVSRGVLSTPGLVIDGRLMSMGRSPPGNRWPPGFGRNEPPRAGCPEAGH